MPSRRSSWRKRAAWDMEIPPGVKFFREARTCSASASSIVRGQGFLPRYGGGRRADGEAGDGPGFPHPGHPPRAAAGVLLAEGSDLLLLLAEAGDAEADGVAGLEEER